MCWTETHSSEVNILPMTDLQPARAIPWITASTPVAKTLHYQKLLTIPGMLHDFPGGSIKFLSETHFTQKVCLESRLSPDIIIGVFT